MSLMPAVDRRSTIAGFATLLLSLALTLAMAPSYVSAQSIEEHFRGKEIRLLIGSSAGGGYDTFARTIAPHWSRHMPGNPAFIPQNSPGPMSLTVANNIFSIASKDGTVVGAINPQIASEAILHPSRARFDAR